MRRFLMILCLALGLAGCSTYVVPPIPPAPAPFVFRPDDYIQNIWNDPDEILVQGIAWCYEEGGQDYVFLSVRPTITDSTTIENVLEHERIHEEQMKRLGCRAMNALAITGIGVALLEGEAYFRAEGIRGEPLMIHLYMYYEVTREVTPDVMETLFRARGWWN